MLNSVKSFAHICKHYAAVLVVIKGFEPSARQSSHELLVRGWLSTMDTSVCGDITVEDQFGVPDPVRKDSVRHSCSTCESHFLKSSK